MIVGHNPGLEEAALTLAGGSAAGEEAARIAEKFPTAALAAFEAPSWRDLRPGAARLALLLRPRDLDA